MPIIVDCPSCGKKLKVADDLIGREVRCVDCARTFAAEKPGAPPPSPSREMAHEPDREDDDYRPSRRRRSRGSYQEEHRGPMILILGILAIVMGGIGLVTGILAWMWGKADLKKMDAGTMDPEGRQLTQIGWILGMVGVILHAIGLLGVCVYIVFVFVIFGIFFTAAATSFPTATSGGFGAPAPQQNSNRPAPPKNQTQPAPKKKQPDNANKNPFEEVPKRKAEKLPGSRLAYYLPQRLR
jgi:hypothetical protein